MCKSGRQRLQGLYPFRSASSRSKKNSTFSRLGVLDLQEGRQKNPRRLHRVVKESVIPAVASDDRLPHGVRPHLQLDPPFNESLPFQFQQPLLHGRTAQVTAEPVPGADDAVARDDQGDGICTDRSAHSPRKADIPQGFGDVSIGFGLTVRESFGFRSTPGAETGFPANGREHRKTFRFPEDIPPIVEESLPIWPDSTRSGSGEKVSAGGIRPDPDQIPPSTRFPVGCQADPPFPCIDGQVQFITAFPPISGM